MEKLGLDNVTALAVSELRKGFKTYEQQRTLCSSHDFFVADAR